MKNLTQRTFSFDVLRAVALFLVVLVHTHPFFNQVGTSTWPQTVLFFFAKLGVPLFVLLSGALLLSKNESTEVFYKKRLQKILLPWMVWACVYLLYKYAAGILEFTSITSFLKELITVFLSDFWFMPMIVGIYILTPYIRTWIQNKVPLHFVLVTWFCLTSLAPLIYLSPLFPGSSSSGLLTVVSSFTGYFVFGWFALQSWTKKISSSVLFVIIALSAIIYSLFSKVFVATEHLLFFATQDYFSPPIVAASIALFILMTRHVASNPSTSIQNIIEKVSTSGYGIFLSHVLITALLSYAVPSLFYFYSSSSLLVVLNWLIKAVLVYSTCSVVITVARMTYIKKMIA